MADRLSIGDAKLAEIVRFVQMTPGCSAIDESAVREVVVADRMGRFEYQHWLDTGPAELIADWVVAELSQRPRGRR